MNAKKIMGAVLVALLAAALFVGAGAAADASVDGKTVFYYQILGPEYQGTWNNGVNSFTIGTGTGANFVSNAALPEGKYNFNDSVAIYLKKPTVTLGVTGVLGSSYIVANGGVVYEDSTGLTFVPTAVAEVTLPVSYIVTGPDKVPQNVAAADLDIDIVKENGKFKLGQYKIQAVFDNNNGDFATGVPADALVSDVIFTFTVEETSALKIKTDADSVILGDVVAVTITGEPGLEFTIDSTSDFYVVSAGTLLAAGQTPAASTQYTIPNTGVAVLYMKNNPDVEAGDADLVLAYTENGKTKTEEYTITLAKGTIVAKTDKESFYIGEDVTISGTTTTGGDSLYLYIKGTNKPFAYLATAEVKGDKTWEVEIEGSDFKKYDAGTYTVYVSNTENTATVDEVGDLSTYVAVSLVLKQPFISITEAPAVAVIGTDYVVTGTAEATTGVRYYIFGTNFFDQSNAKVEDGAFEIEFPVDDMDAGQYFMVVQHPMYDTQYNIQINKTAPYISTSNPVYLVDSEGDVIPNSLLFNVTDRQKTNAAQAFCDALDSQNIDDMYVKLSFVVAAQSSVINPIPAEVTKGSKLTVSGSTNVGEGKLVTVDMVSTAFAAQPKELVGSASFITLTTKTDENGNWEIVFDTTGLNVDEYTVTAAVADLNKATAKVNIIEGAPTEQPTTTPTTTPTQTQPTEPTTPETPGFGALAALAGLGAVAVLLLRRE